ncbi:CLUMA_CG009511, isoform A [Clunio marinus]|uniref:CLUMA_CG009511, isoform A n=1 Tax=Clunio marinus TaxID=568069 RepID=A0A1J1I7C4_9DIPT|nr:CLUMA_CG009511, isoform A [Clunio marinus]
MDESLTQRKLLRVSQLHKAPLDYNLRSSANKSYALVESYLITYLRIQSILMRQNLSRLTFDCNFLLLSFPSGQFTKA